MLGNLFKSVSKSASGITKNPFKASLAGVTGGMSLAGNDILFGKKAKDIKGSFAKEDPRLAQLNKRAQTGRLSAITGFTDEINRLRGQDVGALANLDLANREKQIGGQFQDQIRRANQLSAQRGLGLSSIGLGQVLGAERNRSQALGDVRAQLPMLQEQYAQNRAQGLSQATSGLGSVFNTLPIRQYTEGAKGQRGGGLLDVALTGAGLYYGGGRGAQAGQGIGQMLRGYA